ncbi:MAG TPA: TonB-dependent receptor [Methylomusa anaerophila]|nr:TonB-dependent receptor [Methylomusa anaerophila]
MAKRIALALTLSTALYAVTVFAEEASNQEPESSAELPPVIVTATKTERPADEVTQKVTVITKKDLEKQISGNRNLSELLVYQPGVSVSALSRNDANWGSYGGLGPKYNTYMLDGIPFDSFADSMALDPAALEQIESQRGSASVMYSNYLSMDFNGNQTPLAGTTNFRLKSKIDSPFTRMSVGFGSYNTKNYSFYNQGRGGKLSYFVGASHESSDYTNYGTNPSWLNMLDNPQYDKTKIYFKLMQEISPDRNVSLFVNHTGHTGDAGRINRDYDHNYDLINFNYKARLNDKLSSEFKIGYRDSHRRWAEDNYPGSPALREHDGVEQQILPADLTFTLKNGKNSTLTFGADYQHAKYRTYAETASRVTQNQASSTNYGVFAEQETVNGPVTFRIGGRYNTTENKYDLISGVVPGETGKTWQKFLWSTGMRYKQSEKISWYANVGNSFVAPAAKQVGGTLLVSDFGVAGRNGQLPNPNLKPESGIAADLGMDCRINEKSQLGIRLFYNQVFDTIVEKSVSSDPSQTKAFNVGKTTAKGAEIEYRQKLAGKFSWFANYTYTHAKISNPGQTDDGYFVPFVPRNMANIGLAWEQADRYSLAVYDHYNGGIFDGSTKFDSYHLLNARYTQVLSKQDKHTVKGEIDLYNILGKKFKMPWQFQDPGFSAQARLILEF